MFLQDKDPELDNRMLILQLVCEDANKKYKKFLKEFKPLVPIELKFKNNCTPIFSAELHFDYDKAVYLPFKYAGIYINLNTTLI